MAGEGEAKSTTFHWADYLVFGLSLAISAVIGIIFAVLDRKKSSTDEYLTGGKKMHFIPVGMSMAVSVMNAVLVIGGPAEIYYYGYTWGYAVIGYTLLVVLTAHVLIPVLYRIPFTSCYEYLEARFNLACRLAGALVFSLCTILFLSVVLYTPALAVSQVTGINLVMTVIVCGLVCTFYTVLGGMKAVIWTDAVQLGIMYAGNLTLIIMAGNAVGGPQKIWDTVVEDGRIHGDIFNPDPKVRISLWTQMIGQLFAILPVYGSNQMIIQRYKAVPSVRHAQYALYFANLCSAIQILLLMMPTGLIMYVYYKDCDPMASKQVNNADQIVPLFLMHTVGHLHGLPGLFLASVFAASLSSVSSAVNALAAVFLQDFIRPIHKAYTKSQSGMSERAATWTLRGLSLFFGLLTIALSFTAQFMGPLFQLPQAIWGMVGGPLMGTFVLAMFFPCCNSWGALTALVVSLVINLWVGIGAIFHADKAAILKVGIQCLLPKPTNMTSPLTSPALMYSTLANTVSEYSTAAPTMTPWDPLKDWYNLSFTWYGLLAILVSIPVGLIVSAITGFNRGKLIDPTLLYSVSTKCCCCCPPNVKACCDYGVDTDAKYDEQKLDRDGDLAGEVNPGFNRDDTRM